MSAPNDDRAAFAEEDDRAAEDLIPLRPSAAAGFASLFAAGVCGLIAVGALAFFALDLRGPHEAASLGGGPRRKTAAIAPVPPVLPAPVAEEARQPDATGGLAQPQIQPPAVPQATPVPAPPPPAVAALPGPAAGPQAAAAPALTLPADEIAALLAKGELRLKAGDIAVARLYFERAADAGDAPRRGRDGAQFRRGGADDAPGDRPGRGSGGGASLVGAGESPRSGPVNVLAGVNDVAQAGVNRGPIILAGPFATMPAKRVPCARSSGRNGLCSIRYAGPGPDHVLRPDQEESPPKGDLDEGIEAEKAGLRGGVLLRGRQGGHRRLPRQAPAGKWSRGSRRQGATVEGRSPRGARPRGEGCRSSPSPGRGSPVPDLGIPDFRSPGSGLWANVNPMEVAHIDAWRARPRALLALLRPASTTSGPQRGPPRARRPRAARSARRA